jgi:aspartyl/asparaginyl-tRNA synthetase
MSGPYTAKIDGSIQYVGNKVFAPIADVRASAYPTAEVQCRVSQFRESPMWGHIARINHRINLSANSYFDAMKAIYTALPLTTRMISSPGAVYGREAISYTSDTCPITLQWFDLPNTAFLSESSQIYLELALMQEGVEHVYSIYNSFRKEEADATHLSEFHHIEYEGRVEQIKNVEIALGLTSRLIHDLLAFNEQDLAYFLTAQRLNQLEDMGNSLKDVQPLPFREALCLLYNRTKNDKYKRFTMETFGSWDEIALTEIVGGITVITQFPLLEVPFYHAQVDGVEPRVADNADFIWPGYREFLGSGHRVRSKDELEEKAEIFDLPRDDYRPYLQSRDCPEYIETSGFGLGWERFLHGLLDMPFIWSACQFPRGHTTLMP